MTGDHSGSGSGAEPLNLVEICAELAKEYGIVDPDAAESLNRWWIVHVLFHPRGKHGELKRVGVVKPPSPTKTRWEMFLAWGKGWGWSDWYCEHRWDLDIAEAAEAEAKVRGTGVRIGPAGASVMVSR